MLAIEAGEVVGYIMKTVVIAFGITMAMLIIRSMKKNKMNENGPEKKP